MTEPNKQTDENVKAYRTSFPEDEARLPWLSTLLDSLAIVDAGVAKAIAEAQAASPRILACEQGCHVCCGQPDVPLFPHEMIALYWYASEKVKDAERSILKEQLQAHAKGRDCPFLVKGSCSVHAVRPISCRQFNVFSKPCSPGEDPYYTRNEDVLVPLPEFTARALMTVIPLYNTKEATGTSQTAIDAAKEAALETIRDQMMNLQDFQWQRLVPIMEQAEKKAS